jgi:hypothetical protein
VGPVSELLSRLLVAYTMEFDNEVERRLPHRTSRGPAAGRTGVPWLVSQPTWANFLDLLDEPAPLKVLPAELVNIGGLQRWGYLTVGPGADAVATLTATGVAANRVFREVARLIDTRWTDRFGPGLAAALPAVDPALPRHLPMASVSRPATPALPRFSAPPAPGKAADYRLSSSPGVPAPHRSTLPDAPAGSGGAHPSGSEAGTNSGSGGASDTTTGGPLSTLLAQELIRFSAAIGGRSSIPMGLGSNVLRVLAAGACRTRDLPGLAGISREAVDGSIRVLVRDEAVAVVGGVADLTERGRNMWTTYDEALTEVDGQWRKVRPALVTALEDALGRDDALVAAITASPEGWRANPPYAVLTRTMLENPAANLPAYPMVSHRGGFPDGS